MKSLRFLLVTSIILLPLLTIAAGEPTSGTVKYAPLIEITGLTDTTGGGSFSDYVDFLYGLSIAIAALLAVIKIIVAGVKYMMSSLPGTKGNAKSEIQGALLGLLLILGAYLILNTINPALTKTTVNFQSLKENPNLAKRPPALAPASNSAGAPAGGAAGTQTAQASALAQLQTAVNPCLNGGKQQVSATLVTIDTINCNATDKEAAIRKLSELCRAAGGTPDNGGDTNSNTNRCVLPKTTATATQTTSTCNTNVKQRTVDGKVEFYANLAGCTPTQINEVRAAMDTACRSTITNGSPTKDDFKCTQ